MRYSLLIFWFWCSLTQANVSFETCQQLTPETLREGLAQVIESQVAAQNLKVDSERLHHLWDKLQLDTSIAAETDKAVATIRANSSYWERYGSTWGLESAERFTQDIVSQVFNSPAFNEKMERLIIAYAASTEAQLAPVLEQAWQQGHACLSTFIKHRYSNALAYQFNTAQTQGLRNAMQTLQQNPVGGLSQHGNALGGIAILVGKRVLQRMVRNLITRISGGVIQRIGGAVATRFIPVIGWVLLAYDFYAAADGILPDVAHILKSPETRREVLAQLESGVQEELLNPKKFAAQVTEQVHGQWQEFRQRYQLMLDLAEQYPEFQRAMANLLPEQLDRYASLTGILFEVAGAELTLRYAQSGKILQLLALPPVIDTLLAESKSPDTVLAWQQRVGATHLPALVRLGIHRYKQPTELSEAQLQALLRLDDTTAVHTLLSLDTVTLNTALSLAPEALHPIALRTDAAGWRTLAWYQQQLAHEPLAWAHFIRVVTQRPYTLAAFAVEASKLRIMTTTDKIQAIDEVAGLGGWLSGLLGGVLTAFLWVAGIIGILLLLRLGPWLWPGIRWLLAPLWAGWPRKPKTVPRDTPPSEKTVS